MEDAFGRLRVSNPTTLFDSQYQYGKQDFIWNEALTGTGASTHLPNESAVQLTVSASGDKVVRQSKQYVRYQPGKSQLILCTFDMGTATTNTRTRVGYFDGNNGVFLQRSGTDVSLVLRSYVSGQVVDNVVPQASWNVDPIFANSSRRDAVDLTKSQIMFIDLEWLGVGTVRAGFVIDGQFIDAHHWHHANVNSSTYMTTANLPVRMEHEATGAIGGADSVKQICTTVISEGGFESSTGFTFSGSNGATAIGVTTRRPILSVRPKLLLNSIANRAQIIPETLELTASSNASYWELVYNPTSITGATYAVTTPATSGMDVDVAGTAITGGTTIASGFVAAGTGAARLTALRSLISRYPLALNIAADTADVLSVVCTSLNATSNVCASLNWREIY